MPYISKEIMYKLSQISCESVAEKLGLDVKSHKTLCFMHDDHHPSLGFFGKNRERWKCLVCEKGGDAISFVMGCTGRGFYQSCLWLCKEFNIELNGNNKFPSIKTPILKKRIITVNSYKENTFENSVAEFILKRIKLSESGSNFLFNKRHLCEEVIEHLNIISLENPIGIVEMLQNEFDNTVLEKSGLVKINNGRLYLRMFTPCLIFPYYDIDNKLVGIQSRYLGNNINVPRFQFLSSQKTRIFNLPVLNDMRQGEDIYISEGVTDCLALLSSGKKAVAIPSATILPKHDLLNLLPYKIHMYPDNDHAGEKAFGELRRFFINMGTNVIKHSLPNDMKDYSDFYLNNY